MPGTFQVTVGPRGHPAIYMHNATKEQVAFLKRALGANRTDDIFYLKRQRSNPFYQGGSDLSEGFVYIEFWDVPEEARKYIAWLNSVYDEEVDKLRKWGMIP